MFGATIVSGSLGLFIAPVFSRLSRLFAPVVTGTTMVLIGVSLVNVAVTWTAGGSAGGAGDLNGMAVAALVVAIILGVIRFARGFLANTAVLIGIVTGFIVTCVGGQVDFSHVASAHWLMVVSPFHFGAPKFDPLAAVTMTVVMLVTMVETSGMLFVLSQIVERPLTSKALARGLRGDAVGAIVGGLFNSLPYTSYSQNVAIVGMTGVRSRYVCAAAGVLLIVLAALPKLSFLVTAIPFPVLGGAAPDHVRHGRGERHPDLGRDRFRRQQEDPLCRRPGPEHRADPDRRSQILRRLPAGGRGLPAQRRAAGGGDLGGGAEPAAQSEHRRGGAE